MDDISKIKYVNEHKIEWSPKDLDKHAHTGDKKIDYNEFDQVHFITEDQKIIQGFLYMHKGKPLIIPEPEPSILYYINAERSLEEILTVRDKLFDSIKIIDDKVVLKGILEAEKLFSEFFLLSTNFIINLYASIEAFNNRIIPNNFTIRIKKRLLDKEAIQRYTGFEDKMKKVVPQIFDKSFVVEHNKKWEQLNKLKEIRDSVIHTKKNNSNDLTSYRIMYRDFLAFDFKNSFLFTKEYINYYKPKWIESNELIKK